ncbi:hypothetical protein E4P24_02025 [Haloferax sp. AS1]|uniref:Uncharacterized protein n=1 Tax=Haloferax volcanii TaxID=2246 RepID=A0A558G7D7_HALVO|nr:MULTISPECIES: hypothetical protein [Haloferax]MBC9985150.1 hypothetical protein [Haloferax sp. AS1]TVT93669.1 hypothetical protein FQA18_16015 [Haloferax volcanii]
MGFQEDAELIRKVIDAIQQPPAVISMTTEGVQGEGGDISNVTIAGVKGENMKAVDMEATGSGNISGVDIGELNACISDTSVTKRLETVEHLSKLLMLAEVGPEDHESKIQDSYTWLKENVPWVVSSLSGLRMFGLI